MVHVWMGFTCILLTNIVFDGRYWDLNELEARQSKCDTKIRICREERIVERGENVGHQHFSFFHNVFKKFIFSRSLKVGFMW